MDSDAPGPVDEHLKDEEEDAMEITELFWIFFLLTAIQPVVQQRLLESSRQRLIARIEKHRRSRVILLVHRQETMSFLGFPLMRYIDINDSEQVLRACEMTDPEVPLDIVLHTPGGLVLAATQIARAVRYHKGKVTVFVPHYAMSGGTLIALGADEIVMSRHAVLGPVDPQLGQYPAASLLKVVARKPIAEIDDETLVMADVGEKAVNQVRGFAKELLERTQSPEKAEELSGLMATGTWTHDYPIVADEASRIGLKVRTDIPPEVLQLMNLFPQPVRRQQSVEYLPIRRRAEQRDAGAAAK
jgi:ClpP class serine protease